jgi:ankyrin repeat protein
MIEELGADVNQADEKGVTPLYSAALQGHLMEFQQSST